MTRGEEGSMQPDDLVRPVPGTAEERLAVAYESKVTGEETYESSARTPDSPSIRQPSTSSRGLGHESDGAARVRRQARSCPTSVNGHDEGSRRDGCCTWCGRKFKAAAQRPNLATSDPSDLELEYRRTYDPDYGTNYWDR